MTMMERLLAAVGVPLAVGVIALASLPAAVVAGAAGVVGVAAGEISDVCERRRMNRTKDLNHN